MMMPRSVFTYLYPTETVFEQGRLNSEHGDQFLDTSAFVSHQSLLSIILKSAVGFTLICSDNRICMVNTYSL